MRIARIFPRRTKATPDDALAFTSLPPDSLLPNIDEIHISVAFTYDMEKAEKLAAQCSWLGLPVKLGGPAFNEPGGDFVSGMYLKQGYVITSRGCNNNCWFCSVPKREGGTVRELPITDGHIILDDNLLACSKTHIYSVFDMLSQQKERPIFTGGLEAKLLKPWHVELLREVKVNRFYFANDTPSDYEPLVEAGKLLRAGGIARKSHKASCYVLIGYPGDTMDAAERRIIDTWKAGFIPYAMLYKDKKGSCQQDWKQFQRAWLRPQIVMSRLKEVPLSDE